MTDDWRRGFDLDLLRAHAAVFAASGKRHVYGAFGLVKERDVATALAAGRIARAFEADGRLAGAALWALVERHRQHRDFAGRVCLFEPGALYVSEVGYRHDPGAALAALEAVPEAARRPVWLEVFEEDVDLRGEIARAGFVYQATKISAASELRGLYYRPEAGGRARSPARPADADAATLLPLHAEFLRADEVGAVLDDLRAFGADWQQHYSSYNKRRSWTAVALFGYSDDPGFIVKPAEMARSWQEAHPEEMRAQPRPTRAWPAFKRLTDYLTERLPQPVEFERLRLMRLSPGGELTRHADITNRDAGTSDGQVARLHVPLLTNSSVRFEAWDARGTRLCLAPPPGTLFYLDQRKPHAVQNPAGAERIHVVMDVRVTPALRAALGAGSL